MRFFLPALTVLAALAACGGAATEDSGAMVIKSFGSLQCSGGGTSLAALQGQLVAANVKVVVAACGTDGLARPAVCGSPDGKIGIFEISSTQADAAAAAGFVPASSVPTAKAVPCA